MKKVQKKSPNFGGRIFNKKKIEWDMKLKTSDFKKALEITRPALAGKEFIEQVTSFTFVGGQVFTFNDALCIAHTIEGSELECVVQSDLLLKYMSKVRTKEITIEQNEKELFIKAGRSRSGFPLTEEIKLPLEDFMFEDDMEWYPLPSDFNEAIQFVAESCSTDLESAKLSSVHLSADGFVEATDRLRLSNWVLEHPLEGMDSVLLPRKAITHIANVAATQFNYSGDWLHFYNEEDGTVLSCRVTHEDYMNTAPILKLPKKKSANITFTDELVPALERSAVFAQRQNKEDEILTVSVMDGKVKLRAESETGSWNEEFVSIDYTGKRFKFAITIDLLLTILKSSNKAKIYPDRIVFTGENWVYLSMLKSIAKTE